MKSQPVPLIDVVSARELLRRLLPEVVGVLDKIEESDGRLKLPPELDAMIEQNALDTYPLLYEKLPHISSTWRTARFSRDHGPSVLVERVFDFVECVI